MTTEARQQEADRVDAVYAYALTELGVASIEEALRLWSELPVTQTAATAAAWLERAVHLILTRRGKAKELALSYYRLVRALRTGATIGHPLKEEPEPEHISLEALRIEFDRLVDDIVPEAPSEQPTPEVEQELEVAAEADDDDLDLEPIDDDDSILVEMLDDLTRQLEEEDRATEEYLREQLEIMGTANLENKIEKIDPETPVGEADRERKRLHLVAGSEQAATGARIAMNGSRNVTFQIAQQDDKVVGWVRQSQTGTPCAFCAMLISRGVLYKSQASAGGVEGNKFHDNCYCVAVVVFDAERMENSPAFAMNRYYRDLWNAHIKGRYSGDDALNAWRRLLNRLRTKQSRPAPEAA